MIHAATLVFGSRRLSRAAAVRTLVLLFGAPAAIFVSPYGLELAHYYKLMLVDAPFARYITEWQPTRLDPLTGRWVVISADRADSS